MIDEEIELRLKQLRLWYDFRSDLCNRLDLRDDPEGPYHLVDVLPLSLPEAEAFRNRKKQEWDRNVAEEFAAIISEGEVTP